MLETLLQPNDTEERCGLILRGDEVVELPNIANNPVLGYYIDPEAVLPYLTAGTITGTWHTHPSGSAVLSAEDHLGFLAWPSLNHFIVGRAEGKVQVRAYAVKEGAVIRCD